MKTVTAFLLLISLHCVHGAEGGVTNWVVTPSKVDPKSVKLTAAESPQPKLDFNYVGKTHEQIRAMHWSHAPVLVMKDGVVLAKAPACAGHKSRGYPDGHGDFDGLTLIFDDLEQAKIAEKVLKREDKKPK